MEAIVLAGGFGTRLKSEINDIPKPMAPIRGIPFLTFLLNKLNRENFTRVILAVGYLHEVIIDFYGDKYKNLDIIYSIEDEPLGTGGSIRNALKLVTEEYVYVLNGDTFFDVSLSSLRKPNFLTIACKYVENSNRYGKVIIENNHIVLFKEKNYIKSGYINGGIYYLKKNIFEEFELPKTFSMEKDFIEKYLKNIDVIAHKSNSYFIDIGVPEDYKRAQSELYE